MASVTELLGRDNPDTTVRLVVVSEVLVAFTNVNPPLMMALPMTCKVVEGTVVPRPRRPVGV